MNLASMGVGLDVLIRALPNKEGQISVVEYKSLLPSGVRLLWVNGDSVADRGVVKVGDLITFDCDQGKSLADVRTLF